MSQFSVAYSQHPDTLDALHECLSQLGENNVATLGFIYATDYHADALSKALAYLRENTTVQHWCGSIGIGICCNQQEFMDESAIAIMLLDIPEESFCLFDGVVNSADEIMNSLANWPAHDAACLSVVHGDPQNPRLPDLIEHLPEVLGHGFLVGGLTSSRKGNLQVADGLTEGGLSGVVFHEDINVVTALSQGCSPIGPVHEVTSCQRNVLANLDGQPALDVFRQDIGEILARDLNNVAGFIFAARPVEDVDTGDYTVRNLVGIDIQKKLLAVGDLFEDGDTVLFCRRDNQTAENDLIRMLTQLKQRAGDQTPRGALYYTCLGRGQYMFGRKSRELEIIRQHLGDVPLIGFYANGEVSRNRLYGYTGVLTLFL